MWVVLDTLHGNVWVGLQYSINLVATMVMVDTRLHKSLSINKHQKAFMTSKAMCMKPQQFNYFIHKITHMLKGL